MIWNESINDIYLELFVKIQDMELINFKHFTYLGVRVIYKRFTIGDKEIENMIRCARNTFSQHRKMLQN